MEDTETLQRKQELKNIANFIADNGLKQKQALCMGRLAIDYFRGTIIFVENAL